MPFFGKIVLVNCRHIQRYHASFVLYKQHICLRSVGTLTSDSKVTLSMQRKIVIVQINDDNSPINVDKVGLLTSDSMNFSVKDITWASKSSYIANSRYTMLKCATMSPSVPSPDPLYQFLKGKSHKVYNMFT